MQPPAWGILFIKTSKMSNTTAPQKTKFLQGHTCKQNAFEVKNYPWGFKMKTSRFYWIESKKGKGDRFCYYTINPKNGRMCETHCSTYSTFMYMYTDQKGHVTYECITAFDLETFVARFEFILNKLDVLYITDIQRDNLRVNYATHIKCNALYEYSKYSEERLPIFKTWLSNTLKHIVSCEFGDLINHDPKPDYNNI